MSSLELTNIQQKIGCAPESIQQALQNPRGCLIPKDPGRDLLIVDADQLPPKKGLSLQEGQGRLLHDLAGIELQAFELGLRTLIEFPEAPPIFRQQLAEIVLSEANHLKLCLQALETLGFSWGHWPTHLALWRSVSSEDSLLDRVLIVHRYLEGSGLDAGDTILRRLYGVTESHCHHVIKVIVKEEVDHVRFGSDWYRELCLLDGIDPEQDFPQRMANIREKVPKRIEPISVVLRTQAGFSDAEIHYLQELRASMSKFPSKLDRQAIQDCRSVPTHLVSILGLN